MGGTIICKECGKAASRDHPARYCFPCALARSRRRVGARRRGKVPALTPKRCGDRFVCVDCGDAIPAASEDRKVRPRLRCSTCNTEHSFIRDILSGRELASQAVSQAKKRGALRPASDFACVDCARPADEYDHRDYNKPLVVEPVCRSCNVLRGPAIPFNQLLVGLLLLEAAGLQ